MYIEAGVTISLYYKLWVKKKILLSFLTAKTSGATEIFLDY